MQHKHPESAASRRVVAQNPAKSDVCLVRRHWKLALGAYLTMVLAGTMAYATFGESEVQSLVSSTLTEYRGSGCETFRPGKEVVGRFR